MYKFIVLVLTCASVIVLGAGYPFGFVNGLRDPVPDLLKVAHSSHCAGCHGYDATGKALVDASGSDVNIYDDWQISMMGLSAHDPFWRATISHETHIYPSAKASIETACLKCHAPLGSIQSHLFGQPYTYERMLGDSLGLDGVSCGACHQQPAKDLGKGHSGNFLMDTNRIFFGPYPNPVQGPMQIYVGFDPVFSDHIYSSGICAGCHTLITETLDINGEPTGNYFVEQATYHEWLNSVFPAQGKECQTCHMPFIADSVVIATDLQALKKRHPFGLHQFFGANTLMLSLMKEYREELDLTMPVSSHAWEESIANNRLSLKNAAELEVLSYGTDADTLHVNIKIANKSGHKFPTGYPSRIAWIELTLLDAGSMDTLFKNGIMDLSGNIYGQDKPFEPHHEVIRSSNEVQVYEMVMSNLKGDLTTRLNDAFQPLKDNRLLPAGFSSGHFTYDTVSVFGQALADEDYIGQSQSGADRIFYKIPLDGQSGTGTLHVRLKYHSMPQRWLEDLLGADSIAQIASFRSMYEGYKSFQEVVDSVVIENIDLMTSGVQDLPSKLSLQLFPNPGNGREVSVKLDRSLKGLSFKLLDLNGKIMMDGSLQQTITLPGLLMPGVYYFLIYNSKGFKVCIPYTIL